MHNKTILSEIKKNIFKFLDLRLEFGKAINNAKDNSLIFFPFMPNRLCCGISALVAFKSKGKSTLSSQTDMQDFSHIISDISLNSLQYCIENKISLNDNCLGGKEKLNALLEQAMLLKTEEAFFKLFFDEGKKKSLINNIKYAETIINKEKEDLKRTMAALDAEEVEICIKRIDAFEDAVWCIKKEVLENIQRIKDLVTRHEQGENSHRYKIFKKINAVLNSLDRLEVRGRDSAGISLLFVFTKEKFEQFRKALIDSGLSTNLKHRTNKNLLTNNNITINDTFNETENGDKEQHFVSIAIVYKCAAEIGALGDNISFLRNQIRNDQILQVLTGQNYSFSSISAHTRWASVGDITEANCHPADNQTDDTQIEKCGIVHVSLNGDIDNYFDLKARYEELYGTINHEITTDTKIIPLQIDHYMKQGCEIEEAFRLALNDFKGSHAISMHTDLAPGKIFLGQKGSGQALFVGLGTDHYIIASELYGIIEETQKFIKLDGEKKGQIVILNEVSDGGLSGIRSFSYDGSPIEISEKDIKISEITSRDIDRQHYPHYFLKEISEAPASVEKTLINKWKISPDTGRYSITLDKSVIPEFIEQELKTKKIKRICFIGQGTAGVAARGCAEILDFYLAGTGIDIRALKSSELSGFSINGDEKDTESMKEDLIIAISQSGTTTDTNKTIDMAKQRGARTIAIVNRRDSDLTFKTHGVLYTSSGRDIEMSVASTKAFYSQITAGAVLGLYIASITKAVSDEFIREEIKELGRLPGKMRTILAMKDEIRESAKSLAVSKNFWATVGSGANKTSADEIRIKLSELCYKTISSDFVEDKKHIDLSSEPLIIICAAGTRESVLGDIIKDTAIFKAHKAAPVVITDEGEERFNPYSSHIFRIPHTKEHFAPVLNTLVGHIWGYYAALSINEGSEFMYNAKNEIQEIIDEYSSMGHDIYEIILEKNFREKIAGFYNEFLKKRRENKFPAAIMGINNAANITLILKYLSGRLPVSDFEIDFGKKGTPANMLNVLFKNMTQAVNTMARPVDAIKHQAKTVTVGTSRIRDQFEGILFKELERNGILISQITNKNVLVIKNLQEIIAKIKGGLLYKISGLNLLGEPVKETRIDIAAKTGALKSEISRVEKDHQLKGTKNIIVREGNVYIGRGRKDGKSILVIPVLTPPSSRSLPSSPASLSNFSSSSYSSKDSSGQMPGNAIQYILSLNVSFKKVEEVSLLKRIKALGGKYTRIKDTVLETGDILWDDRLLDLVKIKDLFGDSAEKIGDYIVNHKDEIR